MFRLRAILYFLTCVGLVGPRAEARPNESRVFRDGLKMMAEPAPHRDLREAVITFTSEAAEQIMDLGLDFPLVSRKIRFEKRVRWIHPEALAGDRLQIFVIQKEVAPGRFTIDFTHHGEEIEVTGARPYDPKRDQWAWDWSNYQTFDVPPGPGLWISNAAFGRAGGAGRHQLSRQQIEVAFDDAIGPAVIHPDYPDLKWHVGVINRTKFVSLIYRDAPSREDVRVYRADRPSHRLVERFLALAAERDGRPDEVTRRDLRFTPRLRQKLAWKHKLTWRELNEALDRPGILVPDPRLEAVRDGIARYYYVTSLGSGRPVAVYVAPDDGVTTVLTAHEASVKDCQRYLGAVASLGSGGD